MIKIHRIIRGTVLLAVFGFMLLVWAYGTPASPPTQAASPPTQASTDSVRAVKLRFTFAAGDTANVTELNGGTIKVEKNGEKLTITPYIRDHGQVELRVFQTVQRDGKEMMEAVDTLLIDKSSTKLTRGNLPFSVQVLDGDKKLQPKILAARGGTCCATTCNGTVICGSCVCTDCGVCAAFPWCECAAP